MSKPSGVFCSDGMWDRISTIVLQSHMIHPDWSASDHINYMRNDAFVGTDECANRDIVMAVCDARMRVMACGCPLGSHGGEVLTLDCFMRKTSSRILPEI